MDTRDSLAWITRCERQTDQSHNAPPVMDQAALSFFNLHEMNPTAFPSSHMGHSVPEISQQGQPSLHSPTEKSCPLLVDQSFECTPELCSPDLAYLDFGGLPEVTDCTSVPLCCSKGLPWPPTLHRCLSQLTHQSKGTTPQCSPTSQSEKAPKIPQKRSRRPKSHSKKAHSLVERRYRENLNGSITQLRLALQNTNQARRHTQQEQEDEPEYRQRTLRRARKSDVLLAAVDYVHQTEVELRHMVCPVYNHAFVLIYCRRVSCHTSTQVNPFALSGLTESCPNGVDYGPEVYLL
jgi:hypothetical protein